MTIEQVIKLGDDLKALMPEIEKAQIYEAPPSVLPPGCPLYTTIEQAGKLFGIGYDRMTKLLKRNADFPAVRMGTKWLIDVPGLYDWMHRHNGEALET